MEMRGGEEREGGRVIAVEQVLPEGARVRRQADRSAA
jgi:hypothetical protein